jgi:hypothetical protein
MGEIRSKARVRHDGQGWTVTTPGRVTKIATAVTCPVEAARQHWIMAYRSQTHRPRIVGL